MYLRFILLGIVAFLFSKASFAQEMGEEYPSTGIQYSYSLTVEYLYLHPSWAVLGGNVVTSSVGQDPSGSGSIYTAIVQFTTPGSGSVSFKNGTTIIDSQNVTISPAVPATPTIINNCGGSQLTRGNPPAGYTVWYWQTTASGTSTLNSSPTYTVTSPGTVYLSAYNPATNQWNATPASVNVTVYSAPSTVYYNSASGNLTLSGNPGTISKWQKRTSGGTWTDIPSSAGLTAISLTGVDENTDFQPIISSGPCTTVTPYTVTVIQQNFEGYISGTTQVVGAANSGSLQLNNFSGTAINAWQYSDDQINWVSVASNTTSALSISNLSATRYYRVQVTKKNTTSYSPAYLVSWYPAITKSIVTSNYAQEDLIRVKETNALNIGSMTPSQKVTTYAYFDGLGRPVQTVTKASSPTQKDIVAFTQYDALGRTTKNYLPYTATGSSFYSTPLTDQASFYNGTAKVAADNYPFSETIFDDTPLQRVKEQGAPGADFQPNHSDPTLSHTNRVLLRSNAVNEIRVWKTNGTSTAYYAGGTLSVNELTDANGNKVITYTDKLGRVLQKKVQVDASNWLTTLYVYESWGPLKYILQPEGVKQLGTGTDMNALLSKYGFKYTYDNVGRLAEKLVPGSAPVYYAYDTLGRLALTQDGNLRNLNKWMFVKYDLQNRPVMQGLYTNTALTSQGAAQTFLNTIYSTANSTYPPSSFYETRGTALHDYTNRSFPKINADNSAIEPLSISYYDTYDFNGSAYTAYVSQGITGTIQGVTYTEGTQGPSLGLPTGSKRLVLGTTNWLFNYVFYDKNGRVIQTRSNNHLSTAVDNLTTIVYDFTGKVLTTKTYHNAGGTNQYTVIQKNSYDFAGRLEKVYHNINNNPNDRLVAQYQYNELGQVVKKNLHLIYDEELQNGQPGLVTSSDIVASQYNNETQLVAGNSIKLLTGYSVKAGATAYVARLTQTHAQAEASGRYMQGIDYRYNIRGWLTSINNAQLTNDGVANDDSYSLKSDYFGMELLYNTADAGLGNTSAFNGNISAMKWKNGGVAAGAADQRSYVYFYDKSDKLLGALFKANTGSAWTKESGTLDESMTYDFNGNILTLGRNQNNAGSAQTMDNLSYTYANGNQLSKVADASANAAGFADGANQTTEYSYNTSGSLTADQNKGISAITYNALGKPLQVNFTNGNVVAYTYDAAGTKLTMASTVSGTTTTTNYVGGFVYSTSGSTSTLNFFSSPEGRVVKNGSAFDYQYAITDHLGNTRVLFSGTTPTTQTSTAGFETANQTTEASNFSNYPAGAKISTISANARSGSNSYYLNGGYNGQVGLAKSYSIRPGDVVSLQAYAKYNTPSGTAANYTSFVSSLLTAFNLGTPAAGETGTAASGVKAFGNWEMGPSGDESKSDAMKVFATIIIFDRNYNFIDVAYQAVTTSGGQLSVSYTAKQPGYAYLYISNEHPNLTDVYFDDVTMTYTPTNIIQSNEYYPFGLQTASSWTRDNTTNNFLGNGGTELNGASQLYDLDYRNYDPILGRMHQVDPMAPKYSSHTPYNYSFNMPNMLVDVNGADPSDGYNGNYDRGYNNFYGGPYRIYRDDGGTSAFDGATYGTLDSPTAAAQEARIDAYRDQKNGGGGWDVTIDMNLLPGNSQTTIFFNGDRLAIIQAVDVGLNRIDAIVQAQQSLGGGLASLDYVGGYGLNSGGPYPSWTHELIIRVAFAGILSEKQINKLIEGSEYADSGDFQDPGHSYMHAMTGSNLVEKYGNVDAAKAASQGLMAEFVYQQGWKFDQLQGSDEDVAFFNLGMGMHPLMDQFSPMHSGFQVWGPALSPVTGLAIPALHFFGEALTVEGAMSAVSTIQNYYAYWK